MRAFLCVLCLSSAAFLSGCASVQTLLPWSKPVTYATRENPVVEIVCLWEPAEGRDPAGMPSRGVNGQLMFFVKDSDMPAVVNGDVKIYVFDDYGPREQWSKPVGEFEFSAQEWNSFASNGMLGPSYQLFVPYMRKHGEQVTCSVRVRLTPADGGPTVYSRVTKLTLPGAKPAAMTDGSIEQQVQLREQQMPKVQTTDEAVASARVPERNSDARVTTIHRWEEQHPLAGQLSHMPSDADRSVRDAAFTPANHITPSDEPLFSGEQPEAPPRHRFRLEAIAGQISN